MLKPHAGTVLPELCGPRSFLGRLSILQSSLFQFSSGDLDQTPCIRVIQPLSNKLSVTEHKKLSFSVHVPDQNKSVAGGRLSSRKPFRSWDSPSADPISRSCGFVSSWK